MGSPVHIAAMRDWFKREFGLCSTKDEDRFSDPDPDCRHTMPRMAGLYVKKGLEIAEMRMKFVERFGDRIGTWVERTLRERSRGKGREDHAEEGTEE